MRRSYDKYAGMTFGERAAARRADREKNAAANAAKREARKQFARTCQCCGRPILANTGTIAHHGYERPGEGWQTQSCMGAKHLPFEVSRDRLGDMIEGLKQRLERLQKAGKAIKAEASIFSFHYSVRRDWAHKPIEHHVDVTRDTFEMVKEAYDREMRHYSISSFDQIKDRALRDNAAAIKRTKDWIAEYQTRFDGWKQTERREGDQWVAL